MNIPPEIKIFSGLSYYKFKAEIIYSVTGMPSNLYTVIIFYRDILTVKDVSIFTS